MVLFDALAILAAYYVFSEWRDIYRLIENGAERISYQNYFSLILLLVFMPIMHLLSFINWQDRLQRYGNGLVIGVFASLVAITFYLNNQIETALAANNYTDCVNLRKTMTFSEFKTYMKSELRCIETVQD